MEEKFGAGEIYGKQTKPKKGNPKSMLTNPYVIEKLMKTGFKTDGPFPLSDLASMVADAQAACCENGGAPSK